MLALSLVHFHLTAFTCILVAVTCLTIGNHFLTFVASVHLVSPGLCLYNGTDWTRKTKTIVLFCQNQQSELLSTVAVEINPSSTYGMNAATAKPVANCCQAETQLGAGKFPYVVELLIISDIAKPLLPRQRAYWMGSPLRTCVTQHSAAH